MPANMKRLIAETFFTLTQQKSIDKITVKDLVEACNISRQSFYYHFQDILEVIEWSAQQAMEKALADSLEAESPEAAMQSFIDATIRHSDLIQKLLNSQKREFIEKMFADSIESYIRELIRNKVPDMNVNFANAEMALCFYASGIAGVLMKYASKKNLDTQKLAKQLCQFLPIDL